MVTAGAETFDGGRLYVYVTTGGVEVSEEANFFHPNESLSLAFNAAETPASLLPDHSLTNAVAGILTRPAGHELEYPLAAVALPRAAVPVHG